MRNPSDYLLLILVLSLPAFWISARVGASLTKPQPFDGYYFRKLIKQGDKAKGGAKDYIVGGKMTGRFAVVAYPNEYRDSGITTFIVLLARGKDQHSPA